MLKTFFLPSAWRGRVNNVVVVDGMAEVSALLIFILRGAVDTVMVDGNVVDEVTTDAAVDDVVFVDFVVDEMVFVDVIEVVMYVGVVVLTFDDIKHAAGGLLVGFSSIT